MAKKKLSKREREKRLAAWRDCGKTWGEANLLVDARKQAPPLKERQRLSGQEPG